MNGILMGIFTQAVKIIEFCLAQHLNQVGTDQVEVANQGTMTCIETGGIKWLVGIGLPLDPVEFQRFLVLLGVVMESAVVLPISD